MMTDTDDDPDETGFMNISYTEITELPPMEKLPPGVMPGLLSTHVLDDTPTQRAGIIIGDILPSKVVGMPMSVIVFGSVTLSLLFTWLASHFGLL